MGSSASRAMCITVSVAVCILIAMVQQGCDSSDDSESPETDSLPEATAEDIWKYIAEDNPYTEWDTFPSERIPAFAVWKDDYVTSWVAGSVAKIYVNDIALAALDDEPRDMPDGSIIIGDLYTVLADREVGDKWLIAGFYKVEGSTARDNDWVSFEYSPGSNAPTRFGTKTVCYSCHEASENDYIWIDSPKLDAERSQMPALEECETRP